MTLDTIREVLMGRTLAFSILSTVAITTAQAGGALFALDADTFRHHVDFFNGMEPENIVNHVPNSEAWAWMVRNVPFFECPDKGFE